MTSLRPALRNIASGLGKFLCCTYGLNFQRSLQPFGEAYYNFGRSLVEVFSKVGLIDKTHPWLRRTMQTRPFEVLSYVCARANWKKPLALPTVMTATITLMVFCGALAATSLITSSMMNVGQAYAASVFSSPSPSTDLALKYMSNSFGISIPGVPLATIDGVVGGFQRMMALYSMAMLVLAGFILLYILTTAIAATAHEGRFGGSGFNQVWAPIRLIVAIGLLVPLPMPGGYNGYNSGQYIVMKIAEIGSSVATNLWIPFATALASRGDVIATPSVTPAAPIVQGVLLNEFCKERYNRVRTVIGMTEEEVGLRTVQVGNQITNYYTKIPAASGSTGNDIQNGYCGATYYEKAIDNNTMAMAISTGFETAYFNMRDAVKNMATTLNSDAYIPFDSLTPGGGNEAAIKNYISTEFSGIVSQYQTDLATAINNTVGDQATQANDAMTTAITEQGWAGASIWFNTIARLNSEVMAASRGMPTNMEPTLSGTSAAITGNVCDSADMAGCYVYKGILVLRPYLEGILATFPTSGVAMTAGAAMVGNVATPSVATGLVGMTSGGTPSGIVGTLVTKALTMSFGGLGMGGPFGTIGTGVEATMSQINPLAQLANIGDWLINKSMTALIAGSLLPMGPSLLVIGIGIMGFSAGILLFYVTPLMPFIRMLFGIAGWLLNVLEAVIAIPLVAIAHLSTKGEGITGDMARTAYFMVLSIFLRPALLIVGMVTALMMFSVGIGILNDLYKTAVTGFMGTGGPGGAGGGLSIIMYTILYVAIAYGMCNLCFKLIEEIPNRAMTWIGQQAAREITQDEDVRRALTHTGEGFIAIGRNMTANRPMMLKK